MIRFLIFLLIILASCMVLLGATGTKDNTQVNPNQVVLSQGQSATPATANANPITFSVNWTHVNVVFVSKILVLVVIVLMAVMNYISFLQKKEEF